MKKAIICSIFAIYFNSCNPFDRSCSCTAMACFEGIRVVLINNPDSLIYHGFSMRISYSDTIESVSEQWPSFYDNEFSFSSYRLRKERPVQIQILLDYNSTSGQAHSSVSQSVDWEPFVCNECSGNSKSCKDDIDHSALIEMDLKAIIIL